MGLQQGIPGTVLLGWGEGGEAEALGQLRVSTSCQFSVVK